MTAPLLYRKVKLSGHEGHIWHNSLPWAADYGNHEMIQFCLCCCVNALSNSKIAGKVLFRQKYLLQWQSLRLARPGKTWLQPNVFILSCWVTQRSWYILLQSLVLPVYIENTEWKKSSKLAVLFPIHQVCHQNAHRPNGSCQHGWLHKPQNFDSSVQDLSLISYVILP